MAKQTIDVGASPNDDTGDALRTGGTTINSNFDEIYAALDDDDDLADGNLNLAGNIGLGGYLDVSEIAAPGAGAANVARLYAVDESGFTTIAHVDENGFVKQMGRDSVEVVRNTTGSPITKGSWVYISGSSGTVPTIALAQSDSSATMPAAGVVIADIGNNSNGQIMLLGDLDSVDTSSFNDGDSMYISDSVAGGITSTEPTGTSITQRVGIVVKGGSVGAGVIAVTIGAEFDPTSTDTFSNKTMDSANNTFTLDPTEVSGLGTIASQAANNVTITGGSISGITDLAIADGGTGASSASAAFGNLKQAATTSASGVLEIATTAETDTGTDTGRAVTPDALAGSIYGTKVVEVAAVAVDTALSVEDGKAYFVVPSELDGMNLVSVGAHVFTAPAGSTVDVQIHNETGAVDMLSTKITIDAAEKDSSTAATPAVIDTANDDVSEGDEIRIDVDQVGSSTAGSGLNVRLGFRTP